ncbi:hypothetical protein IV494_05225 [Kaistella sp. G5-32]|uniref:C1q domain-containing protein n=1 Tax=Kaistella gelatinilytica TaxID=2787636 RepID=A0ABS0FA60_9FLAO|nr:hypothetical protein [Kaistella gelatinilytica]MBF8456578.1 hypothetical protein [Kaistella gelatinilytica]
MKKSIQIFALLFCVIISAQAPEKLSYQAVIRNASNALITNTMVGVKISILKTSSAGTVVYAESQTPTTNSNGLISIQIGAGSVISGTIAGINWSADSYYIKTETDPAGGTNYTIAGTSQLLSVPYALYAKNSGGGSGFTLPYSGTATNASSLFQVTNNGAGSSLEGINTSIDNNISALKGVINSTSPGSFAAAVRGINNGTSNLGIGVYGSQNGSGWGVYGTTPAGIGVYGNSSGTGSGGYFTSTGIGYALITNGSIQLNNNGEGTGKVLTSDAGGNASWQDLITPDVHFSSLGGSTQAIPDGATFTVIDSWTGLEETGGANYNTTTGEYTVPITGYYYITAKIGFYNTNTVAGGDSSVGIQVDNVSQKTGTSNYSVIGQIYGDSFVDLLIKLTAGQKIRIRVYQHGGPTNNLYPLGTNFTVNLIHK